MKKLKSDVNILDRLSELPDSLILEILSLLEMRDVVRTTLVSKRWKDLWFTIPCLNFRYYGNDDLVKIRTFVYRTLTLWRGSRLREFSLHFSTNPESAASLSMDMALWVHFATERKVEDLCIQFWCCGSFRPPQCLYECLSIRKLLLSSCNLQIRGNVKWDRLNTLKLDDCVFSEDVMNQVFSSSPQLQDFTISCFQRFQSFSIRSSSLKKLCIDYCTYNPSVLTIWSPNLQLLKYSGSPYVKCLLTDISSLTEVCLDFSRGSWGVALKEALCQILPVIQHVVSVQLSASCIEVLKALNEKYSFSPLLNVKLLSIDCWSMELSDIVGLLGSFSKLKMLIIDWRSFGDQFQFDAENLTESEANMLKPNLLELRTVVITWHGCKASFFGFIEFLLEHAAMIEKMVIRKSRNIKIDFEEMYQASQKLVSLQRSFPSVELILC